MLPGLDQLLLPQRAVLGALRDLTRIAEGVSALGGLAGDLRGELRPVAERLDHAVSTLDDLRDQVAGLRTSLEPMSDDLDGLRQAFQGSNIQLEKLREALTPELRGIREAAEPLHGELHDQRGSIDSLDAHLEEMGEQLALRIGTLGESLTARLAAVSGSLAPLERDVAEVRDVVEPLQNATERVGRLAERLPGQGRTR